MLKTLIDFVSLIQPLFWWWLTISILLSLVVFYKSPFGRTAVCMVVLFLFAVFPARRVYYELQRIDRLARFEEKCRTAAGFRIYKVVNDVEGILLPEIRSSGMNVTERMTPGAAFQREPTGNGYILSFLMYRHRKASLSSDFYLKGMDGTAGAIPGFRYVDVIDRKDGKRYRYTPAGTTETAPIRRAQHYYYDDEVKFVYAPDRVPAPDPAPRYAVTFEDHVIPEERALGLASSTVKVIDTWTDQVLGEMTRYVFLDVPSGHRGPFDWRRASECPDKGFYTDEIPKGKGFYRDEVMRRFVDQILIVPGAPPPPTYR